VVRTAVLVVGVGAAAVVVVVVSREVVVAVSMVGSFVPGVLSNEFREAPSHFTWKCKFKADHNATTVGELRLRSLYQSLASESNLQ